MLTELTLVLVVACCTAVADITGTNPASGSCLCFTGSRVNVRTSACGSSVISAASAGSCYRYKGAKQSCSLGGARYDFFRLDYGGRDGWAAGTFLRSGAVSSCGQAPTRTASSASAVSSGYYTCSISHSGKRVQETLSATSYDCKDAGCGNTCKGGQCVAYVTCNCKRGGQWAPSTSCWRPGTKVVGSDGKCNRSIPANTAIATFTSTGKYYYSGHAAVFVGCVGDTTIKVYDQYCSRSVGYSTYTSSSRFYNNFAVITNPGVCPDRPAWPCRVENSGPTQCPASQKHCN